jgi:3-hydroxyacyl-CoA dehydrogenase
MFVSQSALGELKAGKARRALAESRSIKKVVVLGANGTMGYGSGALFASAVPEVTFLARTKEKAEQGLAAASKMLRSNTIQSRVTCGSYDADLERAVAEADLVFEAVTEILDLKREFFKRVDAARRPDSIVCTVTSGLSINSLAEDCSDSFRKNFCGLHFFNPPNVIVGTELVAGKETDPAVLDFVEAFAIEKLGRVMIRTHDTPGFAGNRVGFKVLNEAAQLAEEHGPLLIDALVGPYTGRAMTPLATIDLVGWDIHRAIVDNIVALTKDEAHETLKLPAYMAELMEKQGFLGRKAKNGFFTRDEDGGKLVLDPKTGKYQPAKSIALPDLGFIKEIAECHRRGEYARGMALFAKAPGDAAKLARKVIAGYIAYSFERVGECTDTITGIDLIMGMGFNWAPPSVLVDVLGKDAAVAMIEEAGLAVPATLADAKPGEKLFDVPTINIGKFFVAG